MTNPVYLLPILVLTIVAMIAWAMLLQRLVGGFLHPLNLAEFEPVNLSGVTAIIPVRNEVDVVDACVSPLLNDPAVSKVIVVDDNSSDGTREVVLRRGASSGKLELVRVLEPTGGWSGKSNACYAGALKAKSEWFLFIDADTFVVEPGFLIPRCLGLAEKRKLDAVTCFGGLRCRGTWDRIAVPFYFALLNSFIKFGGRKPYFIGSFILIKKEGYFAIGGHAAVAGELVEDKALSDAAVAAGLKIGMVYAPKLLSTEWAPGFRNGTGALSREIFPQMRPRPSSSLAFAAALTLLFALPIFSIVLSFGVGPPFRNVLLAVGLVSLALEALSTAHAGRTMQLERRYRLYSLLFFLPEAVFLWVLWSSAMKLYTVSEVRWRGRTYHYERASA